MIDTLEVKCKLDILFIHKCSYGFKYMFVNHPMYGGEWIEIDDKLFDFLDKKCKVPLTHTLKDFK